MLIKICGIQSIEAARAACEAGADLLGFVFARSNRQVTKVQAKSIISELPSFVKTVGVFVNEETDVMNRIANEVGLDYVQCHGNESLSQMQAINKPTIKAQSITDASDVERLSSYPSSLLLVDSPFGPYEGGNGTTFDWSLIHNTPFQEKLILAGGLNSDNVAEAIRIVRPYGVDVSSGVETYGVKDLEKIKSFIRNAREAFNQTKECSK